MSRFTLPRDIYYGANALENLKNLKGSRAVLVLGGGSMKKFGFVDKALGYLKEAGIETRLIENVEPDPSVETVMSGAAVMREFEPDWIISMGGGSPIDAAKAMWAFYEYPETTFEDLITPFSFPELRQKARFCAIPSTSGTATEVTAFSVITDYQKGIKYPLADFNITPDVAIIDPALAETMPPKLVAHTGMDALTHAIEAYVSTLHTVFTDPLALKAIHIVEKDLLRSFNGGLSSGPPVGAIFSEKILLKVSLRTVSSIDTETLFFLPLMLHSTALCSPDSRFSSHRKWSFVIGITRSTTLSSSISSSLGCVKSMRQFSVSLIFSTFNTGCF